MQADQQGLQFCRYICKVFDFNLFLDTFPDSRLEGRIPARTILGSLLVGLWTRIGSINQIGRMGLNGELAALVADGKTPGKDTLGRFLDGSDLGTLRRYLAHTLRVTRRNKAFPSGTLAGWTVAALDGSEIYKTRHYCKNMAGRWAVRQVKQDEGYVPEYYERAVGISYCGVQPRLCLGIERQEKGEDEVAAGLRLIRHLDERHGPVWCDVLVVDALYPRAPFINEFLRGNRHVVVKVKQEDYHIVRDAEALFAKRQPSVRLRDWACWLPEEEQEREGEPSTRYDVEIWDEEHFTSWEQVERPLRCVKIVEVRKERQNGRWVAQAAQTYYLVTSLPRSLAKPELLWLMIHRRWDIENTLFNDLTQNWAFKHCYTHSPEGIQRLHQLFAIARNLFLVFFYRNLRAATRKKMTWIEWGRLIYRAFGLRQARSVLESRDGVGRWLAVVTGG